MHPSRDALVLYGIAFGINAANLVALSNTETACTVTDPQVTGTIISSNDSTNASCTACNPNDAQSSNITKKTPSLPVMVGNEDLYLLAALMVQRVYHAYQINCNAAISSYQTYIGFMQKQK